MKKVLTLVAVLTLSLTSFAQSDDGDTTKFYITVTIVKFSSNKVNEAFVDTTADMSAVGKAIERVSDDNGVGELTVVVPVNGPMFVKSDSIVTP
jgi:hypothetical protein